MTEVDARTNLLDLDRPGLAAPLVDVRAGRELHHDVGVLDVDHALRSDRHPPHVGRSGVEAAPFEFAHQAEPL